MKKMFRPGVSFGDFVISDMKVAKSRVKDEVRRDYRRGWLVWLLTLVSFGVLVVRLVELQIFKGGMYATLADENRIKRVKIPAPRGEIVDRNGVTLARAVRLTVKREDGLEVEGWRREYPLGEATGHVVGYLGEVGKDEVGFLKEAGQKYEGGDLVGRMGLEMAFEKFLRGVDGGRLVEVNNVGEVVRELGKKAPIPGAVLETTLDAGVQTRAWEAMGGRKGAVVVSVPRTGEVLAMVSSPGFDPNWFGRRDQKAAEEIERILKSPDLPMFDRSIGGQYPPGSTFKMVTLSAALESGKVSEDFVYNDTGMISVGSFRYTNWLFTKNGGVEGVIGFKRALARSTDTFFYKVGELIGPDTIAEWARKYGLGEKTGVVLAGESEGLVSTPEWKKRVLGEDWFLGNTYHVAIGQGDILTTPLQINVMTNAMANGGKKCRPKLVRTENSRCEEVGVSERVLGIIIEGMTAACSSGGTAFPIFDWNAAAVSGSEAGVFAKSLVGKPLPVIACKTGTAEYMAKDGRMRTHGWLTAFAPVGNPEVSVTAVAEGGGEGSNTAAPIVRKIMAEFFGVEDRYPYSAIPQVASE